MLGIAQVGQANRKSSVNDDGLLVRRSPVDGAIQIVVPQSLSQRVLLLPHHPPTAGHRGRRRVNDTLQREFYWPHMTADIERTVSKCGSCARSLDFVATDIPR